jgi:hypothetical protein
MREADEYEGYSHKDKQTCRLMGWLILRLADWQTGRLSDWQTFRLADCQKRDKNRHRNKEKTKREVK